MIEKLETRKKMIFLDIFAEEKIDILYTRNISWFKKARLIFHFDCSISDRRRIKRQLDNVADLSRCARSESRRRRRLYWKEHNATSLAKSYRRYNNLKWRRGRCHRKPAIGLSISREKRELKSGSRPRRVSTTASHHLPCSVMFSIFADYEGKRDARWCCRCCCECSLLR